MGWNPSRVLLQVLWLFQSGLNRVIIQIKCYSFRNECINQFPHSRVQRWRQAYANLVCRTYFVRWFEIWKLSHIIESGLITAADLRFINSIYALWLNFTRFAEINLYDHLKSKSFLTIWSLVWSLQQFFASWIGFMPFGWTLRSLQKWTDLMI